MTQQLNREKTIWSSHDEARYGMWGWREVSGHKLVGNNAGDLLTDLSSHQVGDGKQQELQWS
jgi:hypothetical protein